MTLTQIREHLQKNIHRVQSKAGAKAVDRQVAYLRRGQIVSGVYPRDQMFFGVLEVLGFEVSKTEHGIPIEDLPGLLKDALQFAELTETSFSATPQLSDWAVGKIFRGAYLETKKLRNLLRVLYDCGLGVTAKGKS